MHGATSVPTSEVFSLKAACFGFVASTIALTAVMVFLGNIA